jgi:hypothetical protein
VRAKQANELEIAYQTLEGAVGQYQSMTQDAQRLADAATAASRLVRGNDQLKLPCRMAPRRQLM